MINFHYLQTNQKVITFTNLSTQWDQSLLIVVSHIFYISFTSYFLQK
jgi:hypothetical protein